MEGVYACLLLYRIGVVCLTARNENAAAAGGAAAGCGCIGVRVGVGVVVVVGAAAGGAACLSSGCLHREGHDCANH